MTYRAIFFSVYTIPIDRFLEFLLALELALEKAYAIPPAPTASSTTDNVSTCFVDIMLYLVSCNFDQFTKKNRYILFFGYQCF